MATFEELCSVIIKTTHGKEDDIKPETVLKDIKADSLHWVQIVVGAEAAFGVEIDIDKMMSLGTMQDFVDYLNSLKK